MISYLVIGLSILIGGRCGIVESPPIRIVDVAQKAYETRFFPHRLDYIDSYHQDIKGSEKFQEGQSQKPFKSYVIYHDFPNKIFKEWEGNSAAFAKRMVPPVFQGVGVDSKAPLPEYYYYYRKPNLPPSNPTLAFQSVFSNVIKVFDNSLDKGEQRFWLQNDRLITLPPADDVLQSFQPPFQYETIYPQEFQGHFFENQRLPENFPKVFVPNEVHFTPFKNENSKPLNIFVPSKFFGGPSNNDEAERNRLKNQAEGIPKHETNNSKNNGRVMLCSLIRLNQRQFPENGGPCSRSEENPILSQEYPDYSKLPNDKIPLEHRRQHSHIKRIKRNDPRDSPKNKTKRSIDFVGEYDNGKHIAYFNDYSNQDGYDNYGSSNYNSYGNRNSKRRNRNGEYNEYDDDDYQNNEDSNSQGLSSYLTNGGRRYRNRQNNDEDDEDNNDNDNDNNNNNNNNNNDNNRDNNNNNNGDNSNEEMEGQNSYGRSMNRRRNNNNSRGRRNNYNNNNNNNNDDEDNRDNNRRNNYNNRQNNRRNNNRYNNRRNNDYYNRNRNSYGNNNNNNNNGYNSYGSGSYGSYGNRGYGNNDYGSSFGSNGYGSSNGYDGNSYNSYGSRGLGFGGYSGYGGYGGYSGYGNYGSGSGYGSFDHDDF